MLYNKLLVSAQYLEKTFLENDDISHMGWSLVLETSGDFQFKRSSSAVTYSMYLKSGRRVHRVSNVCLTSKEEGDISPLTIHHNLTN